MLEDDEEKKLVRKINKYMIFKITQRFKCG
jgi:hypothetical protein